MSSTLCPVCLSYNYDVGVANNIAHIVADMCKCGTMHFIMF